MAIVGYPDEILGEKCRAVVVPDDGKAPTLADLVKYLRGRQIASFKLPEKLVMTTALPRSPVGKVLRRALREEVNRRRRPDGQ